MKIDWKNISEIMLTGSNWNTRFTDQWYKVTEITGNYVNFETQVGIRDSQINMIESDNVGYACLFRYKNPLLEKLYSM